MCQPKSQGGRRCPTHQPASIALKRMLSGKYRLLPEQVEHTFRRLRHEGAAHQPPTMAQYQHLIGRIETITNNSNLDQKDKDRIVKIASKELSETELPDGATYYALKNLSARCRKENDEFSDRLSQVAEHHGVSSRKALLMFKERYAADNETRTSKVSSQFDARSEHVFKSLLSREGEVEPGLPTFSTEPRITREPVPNSSFIESMGYDPDDGRLEVEMRGKVYAYTGVPESVWAELQERPSTSYNRHIARNRAYQYASSEEAASNAFGRYCRECKKYRAISGHVCEGPATTDTLTAEQAHDNLDAFSASGGDDETYTTADILESMRLVLSDEDYEEALERTAEVMEANSELTYDQALARVVAKIHEEHADEDEQEVQPPPPPRLTAKQRRWMVPVEGRETVTASEDFSPNLPGSVRDMRKALNDGKVFVFPNKQIRYDYRSRTSTRYSMDYEAYLDGKHGVIKVRPTGNARCSCDEYRESNYRSCSHISAYLDFAENDNDAIQQSRALRTNGELLGKVAPDNLKVAEAQSRAEQGMEFCLIYPRSRRVAHSKYMNDGDRTIYYSAQYSQATIRQMKKALDKGLPVEMDLYVDGSDVPAYPTLIVKKDAFGKITASRARSANEQHDAVYSRVAAHLFEGDAAYSNVAFDRLDARIAALDEERNPWALKDDVIEDMKRFAPPTGVDRSYSSNLDQYVSDVRAVRERVKNGESALEFQTENVTNGVCSPESGRGFGIEIEYDLPGGSNRNEVMQAIARDLHEEGLSDINNWTRYHGYRGNRWHIERDCSVAGEVVSPILHDTPEHWEELRKVCEIIKRHGGRASTKTGGHIHMGIKSAPPGATRRFSGDPSVEQTKANVLQIYGGYKDTLRRLTTNMDRKKHRTSSYCAPISQSSIRDRIISINQHSTPRGRDAVNLNHRGRVEFREPDGSIDPAEIQARVIVASGIVAAAERARYSPNATLHHSEIGTNAKRVDSIKKKKGAIAETDDELIVSDVEMRRFADDILPHEAGRKVVAAFAATVPWQTE